MSSKHLKKSGRQPKPTTNKPSMLKPDTSGTLTKSGKTSEDRELLWARRVLTSMPQSAAKAGASTAENDPAPNTASLANDGAAACGAVSLDTVANADKAESSTDDNVTLSEAARRTDDVGDGANAADEKEVAGAVAASEPPTADKPAAALDAVTPECSNIANAPAADPVFSRREKFDPQSNEVWSVDDYVNAVRAHWTRSVESLLNVGRVCSRAQEDKRLNPAKLAEISTKMPFRSANFSKWVQIGKDERLRKPEIRHLLPPTFTALYVITTLSDDELQLAIKEKILHSDVTREAVLAWRDAHREAQEFAARGMREPVASPPIVPINESAELGGKNAKISESAGEPELPFGSTDEEPATESSPGAADDGALRPEPAKVSDVPSCRPNLPTLSPDDQQVLELLVTTWEGASEVVRKRFCLMVFGETSASRH